MFKDCINLSFITCVAQNPKKTFDRYGNSVSCICEWVSGVKRDGTFIKKKGVNWETGVSGIPEGWTVIEVE